MTFKIGNFASVPSGDVLQLTSKQRLTVRCENFALVYGSDNPKFKDETMLGGGSIQFEIMAGPGFVRFETEGRIWIDNNCADQLITKTTEEVFTSLDRPSPLTPEMAAIHRMMRQNEIAREHDRAQMMKELHDAFGDRWNERQSEVLEALDDPNAAPKVRQDAVPGTPDAEGHSDQEDVEPPNAPALPGK